MHYCQILTLKIVIGLKNNKHTTLLFGRGNVQTDFLIVDTVLIDIKTDNVWPFPITL